MTVHAERSTNAENIDGLHRLHGKTFFIEQFLKLPPPHPRLDVDDPVLFIKLDAIETLHIQK